MRTSGGEEGEARPAKRLRSEFVPYRPRGPVQTPFQATLPDPSAVQLDFNFWVGQGCIAPADLGSLMLKVLADPARDVPFLREHELDGVSQIHLFLLHGVNGDELDDRMPQLKFLRTCSSVPIRHSMTPWTVPTFRDDRSSQRLWRYNEVEDMTSLILWPERPYVPWSEVADKSPFAVFRRFDLLFRLSRGGWSEMILLSSDADSEEPFNRFVLAQNPEPVPASGGLFGRFHHQTSSNAGDDIEVLHVKSTQSNSLNMDIGHFHLFEGDAGETRLVLVWKSALEGLVLRDEGSLTFAVSSQGASDTVTVHLERLFPSTSGKAVSLRHPPLPIAQRPSMDSADYLPWLSQLYIRTKDQLGRLLLSPDMMTLMGYVAEEQRTVFVYDERGTLVERSSVEYVSTSRLPSRTRADCTEVEDGEEAEESETTSCDSPNNSSRFPLEICAIDCEMVTTGAGQELGRVSIVSPVHGVVYDTFVKPDIPVLNYNTEFSGVTREKLEGVTTTLKDVQSKLKEVLHASTIIVGHSLENDFKTLGLHHTRMIDTAAIFPHVKGLPMKLSLKRLAEDLLRQPIQSSEVDGHSSTEDAFIALELALMKATGYQDPLLEIPHLYSEFPRNSVWDHINRSRIDEADVRLFSFRRLRERTDWERYALGLKPPSDVVNSIRFSQHKECNHFKIAEYDECYNLFEDVMKSLDGPSDVSSKRVSWVDMPFNSFCGDSRVWVSLESVDECLGEAFNRLSPGSLMIVVTQGDISSLRFLGSRKQQNKWDRGRVFWSEEDESALIMAAAHCLSGATFLKRRSG